MKLSAGSAVPADCVVRGEEGGGGKGSGGDEEASKASGGGNIGASSNNSNRKKTTVSIDNSAMTGESLPATLSAGGTALMGATCVRGEVEALVTATGASTAFGRTAALLGGNSGDGSDNITRVLVRVTLVLSLLRTPDDALYRALAVEGADATSGTGATFSVHRIGDCVTPRAAGDAIYEGELLGRAL